MYRTINLFSTKCNSSSSTQILENISSEVFKRSLCSGKNFGFKHFIVTKYKI